MFAMSRVKRTRPPLAETSMRSLMFAAVERPSRSLPSWPSTTSLPSPGSHWKRSSPAPMKPTSLPCWPSTKSLPSPPRMMSAPLLPSRCVVAGAAVDRELDQRGQVAGRRERVVAAVGVEDEVLGGADVDRERRRVEAVEADAGAVGRGRELLGAVAAVDLDRVGAVAALVEVGVVAGVPDHAVVAALAERPGRRRRRRSACRSRCRRTAGRSRPCRAACRCRPGRTAGRCRSRRSARRCRAPPNRFAAGSAPLTSLSVIVSLPPRPKTWIVEVLATVGVPPMTATAPPLTRMLPGRVAADRDVVVEAVAVDRQHAGAERGGGGRAARARSAAASRPAVSAVPASSRRVLLAFIRSSFGFGVTAPRRRSRPGYSGSVGAGEAEHLRRDEARDEVVGDRRDLVEPGLAELALHVVGVDEAQPAVCVEAHIGGGPARLGARAAWPCWPRRRRARRRRSGAPPRSASGRPRGPACRRGRSGTARPGWRRSGGRTPRAGAAYSLARSVNQ